MLLPVDALIITGIRLSVKIGARLVLPKVIPDAGEWCPRLGRQRSCLLYIRD
jgi:hypothetical protein